MRWKNLIETGMLLLVALVILNGCVIVEKIDSGLQAIAEPEDAAPGQKRATEYVEHRVRWRGENLLRISWWYTGSGTNWRAIADANPSIPVKKIRIGDVLRIPADLVTRREAMPEEYRIPTHEGDSKKQASEEEKPTGGLNTEPLDLFGPVDTGETSEMREDDEPLPLQTID